MISITGEKWNKKFISALFVWDREKNIMSTIAAVELWSSKELFYFGGILCVSLSIDSQFSWNDLLLVSWQLCLQTLAVQKRYRRPRLEAPQRLHAAALLQIQQLD